MGKFRPECASAARLRERGLERFADPQDKLEMLRAVARPDAAILNTGRFREDTARLTDGRQCDLVFDPVGGDVFDESTRCVTFGGKLLVIGFVSGRIPEIAVNIPLIKGFSVVGIRAGEYARRFPQRGAHVVAVFRPVLDAWPLVRVAAPRRGHADFVQSIRARAMLQRCKLNATLFTRW